MNVLSKIVICTAISFMFLTSCEQDEPNPFPGEQTEGCYLVNFGLYSYGGASITKYNHKTGELVNCYYQAQNNGLELLSNIQYAGIYNDSIYLIGNVTDQLITVDPLFRQTRDGITGQIANPRFFAGTGDYLYISCYGENPDWMELNGSYVAQFNILTQAIVKTIPLPGGPEGLAVANGKLFVALNFRDSIAVINLSDHSVSYIETPAVPSYFVKDPNENLYVTLISTHTDPSYQTGIGFINTVENKLGKIYPLDGVSSGWSSVLSANSDCSTLYVLASAWVEETADNWVQKGAAYTFDIAMETFTVFAENLTGANGIVSNPVNNDVYILTGASVTEAGSVLIYHENGTFVKDFPCGISPYWALFLE